MRPPPKPRHATIRSLRYPSTSEGPGEVIDREALILYFPSPKSVTGEDVLELHVHGGTATVRSVLSAIPQVHSKSQGQIRYAEPGEFTRRAFLNGRLDLAQIEALSDALDAETEQQRKAAVRGQSGKLGRKYDGWRTKLLHARAEVEALIDFSEDQHFDESPAELLSNVMALVGGIVESIRMHQDAGRCAELLRSGIKIALIGPPNAGKSSLMNLIVGREASIVSHEAGTTRDVVEASLDIQGYLCSFSDTAGFRSSVGDEAIGAVEMEGIRRARHRALESDIILVLASIEYDDLDRWTVHYDPGTLELAAQTPKAIVAVNKTDLVDRPQLETLLEDFRGKISAVKNLEDAPVLGVSCAACQFEDLENQSRGGLQRLVGSLVKTFTDMTELPANLQDLLGVTARQAQLLSDCRQHLETVLTEASPENKEDPDIVLVAENLRIAANFLAKLTGRGESGDIEEVLGVVFEK